MHIPRKPYSVHSVKFAAESGMNRSAIPCIPKQNRSQKNTDYRPNVRSIHSYSGIHFFYIFIYLFFIRIFIRTLRLRLTKIEERYPDWESVENILFWPNIFILNSINTDKIIHVKLQSIGQFDNNVISLNLVRYIASIFRPLTCSVVIYRYGFGRYPILSGAPNDSFLSNPLKRNFRLSGVPLKLCRFISGRAIIFLSVRSF